MAWPPIDEGWEHTRAPHFQCRLTLDWIDIRYGAGHHRQSHHTGGQASE